MHGSQAPRRCLLCGPSVFSSRDIVTFPRQVSCRSPNRFRADKIPADAIYLDIDSQEKNRPFSVDKEAVS